MSRSDQSDLRTRRFRLNQEAQLVVSLTSVRKMAQELGFDDTVIGRVSTVLSELGRNIFKYAGRGEIVLTPVDRDSQKGLEIVAHDRGPGIADLDEALKDHFSTSGTLGLGLPGVRRMADEFDIDSMPGVGTTVTVRFWVES